MVPLARYVVSASRTPHDLNFTPSSVTLVSLADLQVEQVTSLATALSEQPGVILYNTGAPGGQSTVSLRGANADQTLFVVDGVRMNDRAASYLNALGTADLTGIDRIEVLRGPQSTLYGSSAMGGVILINTAHGAGPTSGSVSATAGSFDSYGAAVEAGGAKAGFSYAGAVSRYETANERPGNDLRQWNASLRLEDTIAAGVLVGTTMRWQNANYEEPGSRFYAAPGTVQSESALSTVYGEIRATDEFTSRLTLASELRQYTWLSDGYASPQSNNREILDWQNTWTPVKAAEIVAGANVESSRYVVDAGSTSDHISAGYVSAILRPVATVTLTAGARYDDYHSVGSATTGRGGVAWTPVPGTKLHATYGTGFNAPSSADRYGVPDWGQLPNPTLVPEKSEGWDAGIDQELAHGALTVSATYFQNKYRNLFEWETLDPKTYDGETVNVAHATTKGVELATAVRFSDRVQGRLAYTYLDAHDDDTGARLNRRPRHTADAEVHGMVTQAWTVGAGLHLVAANINGTLPFGGYTTARVFTSYALRPTLLLKLHIENALNRHYEEVYGYPALSRGVFGSAEFRF